MRRPVSFWWFTTTELLLALVLSGYSLYAQTQAYRVICEYPEMLVLRVLSAVGFGFLSAAIAIGWLAFTVGPLGGELDERNDNP